MVFNIVFHPTKTFQSALESPNMSRAVMIVLLTALFFALAGFFLTAKILPAVYLFIFTIVQWVVYSAIIWFFEFIHVRKRKKMTGTSFAQCASLVGELWKINLISGVLFAVIAFILPFSNSNVLFIVGAVFIIIALVLLAAWLVASFRMISVLVGVQKWKLIVNWVVINLLNILLVGFISSLLGLIL
jgi:hypothetical protein